MAQPASTTNAAPSKTDESTVQEGSDINNVVLAGRLGREAEMKETKDGRTVTNFSMGVGNSYKDRTEERTVRFLASAGKRKSAKE